MRVLIINKFLFQLSDLFYNTVGGMIGGLMYYGIAKAKKHEENRKVSSRTKAGTAASSEVFGEWHRRTCQRIRHRAELQHD